MKKIKIDKIQLTLVIVCLILCIFLIRSCQPPASENTYKQNIAALTDSIRSYKSKNGTLIYEKSAFISESGSLKKLNADLASEVQNLKDNPIVVIKTKTVIKRDTIRIPIYSTKPGIWVGDLFTQPFDWTLDEDYGRGNYRKMSGEFDVSVDTNYLVSTSQLRLTTDELGIAFTTGLTENDDGLLEIFVLSDYPGFRPTTLDGALIDPGKSLVLKKYFPPKRWALGVYGGYGAYFDPAQTRVGTGIQLGIGLQYNLIQWNFKK